MSGKVLKPNRLGWVTNMNINMDRDYADVTSYSDQRAFLPTVQRYEVNLNMMVEDPGAAYELLTDWMRNGVYTPTFQKEYMCLYCGSPNPIECTHCRKCGAPRSFVLG